MSSRDELRILALEEQLVDPQARRSREGLEALLADDFVVIGAGGKVYDRAAAIVAMLTAPDRVVTLSDFGVRPLSHGIYLATYRTGNRLRTSIWREESLAPSGAKALRVVFHQATRVEAE